MLLLEKILLNMGLPLMKPFTIYIITALNADVDADEYIAYMSVSQAVTSVIYS